MNDAMGDQIACMLLAERDDAVEAAIGYFTDAATAEAKATARLRCDDSFSGRLREFHAGVLTVIDGLRRVADEAEAM